MVIIPLKFNCHFTFVKIILIQYSFFVILGLHYIHSKGIVYCDLKPSSVLLNEYDTLKYCDFGLAKKVVDLILTSQEVEEGSRKGTPSYMAPELY